MQISLSSHEEEIVKIVGETADELGLPVFLVGGFVRDKILGRGTKDIDFVSLGDGSGVQIAEALGEKLDLKKKVTIFKRFGTAMLKVNGMELEFVGARKESYQKDSRNPIVENGSLEDDQNRRDFTINALAVQINNNEIGEVIDPFGGLDDLKKGVIRTPLDPIQTFSDDPLRIMRAIRFATQLDYTIEERTLESINEVAERIDIVSPERIRDELNKIIMSPVPSKGFKLLFNTKVLERIFPDLVALHGVEIKNGVGHKDNFYHTLQVLDNICPHTDNLWLRWAAILHDIAKPPTKRFHQKAGWTFHGHEAMGAKMVPRIFKSFKLPLNEKMKYVQKLVRLHLRPISLVKEIVTDSAVRRLVSEAGEDVDDLMTLCEADITSKNLVKVKKFLANFALVREKIIEVEERDKLRTFQPPVTGEVIMKTFDLKPCKEIGILKSAIKNAIIEGEIKNDFDEAFAYMLQKAEEIGLKTGDKSA